MKLFAGLTLAACLFSAAAAAFDANGSGAISDGGCVCKSNCNKFARAGQYTPPQLAQCKSSCEQRFAGCNKGAQR